VKHGGSIIVVVPFLFPVHPSPHDYHRFTKEALERELARAGCANIVVTPLGSGVFTARYLLLDRLMPRAFRVIGFHTWRHAAMLGDRVFAHIARARGKKYDPADYALGYLVVARKK